MSDLPFDIDDILNEINKRKEEIEKEINSVSLDIEGIQSKADESEAPAKPAEAAQKPEPEKTEAAPEPTPEKPAAAPMPAPSVPAPEKPAPAPNAVEKPAEEPIKEPAPEASEVHFNDHDVSASYFNDVDKIFAESGDASEPAEEKTADEGSVNIFDMVDDAPKADGAATVKKTKKSKKEKKAKANKKWKKSKKGKVLISIILVLVIVIAGTGAFGFYYVNNLLNNMTNVEDDPNVGLKTEEWKGMDELVVKFDDIYEDSYVYSYRDMVRTWYYNGEPASSSNILNILLIGEDTRGDEIKDSGSLADSVIIASVNTETGELILSSILRDTYAYYELTPGDESTGTYGKINECMSRGGLSAYINAVERLFKINIDNYVLVNFANFKKIIDSLGGVTIEMTAAEIREINNHPGTYGDVYIDGDAGMKLLNGEQALAYCRIRHLDGDQFRADRQKTVLLAVFTKLKSSSMIKLTGVVTNLLPYVKTGFRKSEILSLGEYALSNGWLSYNVVTHTVPQEETRTGGQGSGFYNVWCWKVDFPLATQILQEKIYGKSNVILAEYRPNYSSLSAY